MTIFSTYTEPDSSEPLSPFKHVNYVLGMVLGVDLPTTAAIIIG